MYLRHLLYLLLLTQVILEIQANSIKIYDFPKCDEDDHEDFKNLTKEFRYAFTELSRRPK